MNKKKNFSELIIFMVIDPFNGGWTRNLVSEPEYLRKIARICTPLTLMAADPKKPNG